MAYYFIHLWRVRGVTFILIEKKNKVVDALIGAGVEPSQVRPSFTPVFTHEIYFAYEYDCHSQ